MRLALVAALLLVPATARADGTVTIALSPDGQTLADSLGISVAQLQQDATDRVAEEYDVYRVDDFLTAFADATSFSNRGIGVDYASNGEGIILGVTGSVAVATDDYGQEKTADHPVAGVAPNLALMGGVNFARFGHPHLTVYGNAFWRKGSLDQLDGSITSMGLHAQYNLFAPTKGAKALVLQWGGLSVTGGVEFSRWSFGVKNQDPIETSFAIGGSGGLSSDVTMSANGRFDLDSNVIVAPIEATTSLRVLYFVSLYAGLGIDFQAGESSMSANLDATLTATDPNGGADVDMGTANVTVSGSQGPSIGKARALAGVQVNVWKLKVFAQLNAMPMSAASAAFGLRLVL